MSALLIGDLIRPFFAALEEQSIPWAVLRGAEGLPERTRYDIDLLVPPDKINDCERVLSDCAMAVGWSVIRIIDKHRYRCCLAVGPGPVFLPIDLFGGCLHRQHTMADGALGLRGRERNPAGVWVVRPGFGALVALIKELMRHPTFKENSREEVREGCRKDAAAFREAGNPVLGGELCERLLQACQGDDWAEVERLVPALRRAVTGGQSRFSAESLRFYRGTLLHLLRAPMSTFVVLLGPDGSGKSTIADLVAERLYQKPFKICRRYEYRFRILPELKDFKNLLFRILGRKVPERAVVAPGTRGSGMNRDHPKLIGMMYVGYYTIDFLVGHFLLRLLRSRGSAVLFARYFHDYYYQLGYRNVPRWYLGFLEAWVPKPDLMIYLDRDAREIHEGKPELDEDEIARQQREIRKLVAGRSYGRIIDGRGGIDRTVEDVTDAILSQFLRSGSPGRTREDV